MKSKLILISTFILLYNVKLFGQGYFGARPDYHDQDGEPMQTEETNVSKPSKKDEYAPSSNFENSIVNTDENTINSNPVENNKISISPDKSKDEKLSYGKNYSVNMIKARKAYKNKLFLETEVHLKEALKFDKKDHDAWFLLSKVYKEIGLKEETRKASLKAKIFKKKPIFPQTTKWPMENKNFKIICRMMIFCEYQTKNRKDDIHKYSKNKMYNFAEKSLQAMGIF